MDNTSYIYVNKDHVEKAFKEYVLDLEKIRDSGHYYEPEEYNEITEVIDYAWSLLGGIEVSSRKDALLSVQDAMIVRDSYKGNKEDR